MKLPGDIVFSYGSVTVTRCEGDGCPSEAALAAHREIFSTRGLGLHSVAL